MRILIFHSHHGHKRKIRVMRKDKTLQLKLILIVVIPTLLIFGGWCTFDSYFHFKEHKNRIISDAEMSLALIKDISISSYENFEYYRLENYVHFLVANPNIDSVAFLDKTGNVLAESKNPHSNVSGADTVILRLEIRRTDAKAEPLGSLEIYLNICKAIDHAKDNIQQAIMTGTALSLVLASIVFLMTNSLLSKLEKENRKRLFLQKELEKINLTLEERVNERTEALQETYQQLAHAGRITALGEMATGIAHELNQPLSIIGLAMQYLESVIGQLTSNSIALEAIMKVKVQIDRASTIIKTMRAFARANQDDTEKVILAEVIGNVLVFFQEQFRIHEINLDLSLADNLPPLTFNPQKLEQVMVNLISNARYAVEKQAQLHGDSYEMQISIRLIAGHDPPCQIIEVEDNGIGMSENERQRCLEPFYTTKETGQGTGLGLSISHNIVREFNGRLEVERKKGNGCLFRIILPDKPLKNEIDNTKNK